MGKKFVGLDGLKHFWTKAKTWIMGQITAEVTAKIAEIVANAPEDLDTLKEIADWISAHANDAAAMNTQITANKNDITALQTSVAGKANSSHTHTKSEITDFPTSLPANGGTADTATRATGISYTDEDVDCISAKQVNASVNNSEVNWASYIICNHGNGKNYYHQMLRLPFFEDKIQLQRRVGGELKGWKNIAICENENAWSGKQTFNAGMNVAGDIQLNSKTLYPSGYVPRTYFIEYATKDNITAEQKELLRKMFAYQSVNRLIQCYGTLRYRFNSTGIVFGGRVVIVGYFDGDAWLDSNDNISYNDDSNVNYACFGVQEDSDDINIVDMYNLSEQVMRNRFEQLNYLVISGLYFTVLEKI